MTRKKKSTNNNSNNNNTSNGIPFGPAPPALGRTVNVSADGGPPQAMTPEAAAKYLQQATTTSHNREVKISFGPSRPPPPNSSASAGCESRNGNNNNSMSFGSLDLQALRETAAAAAAAQRSGGPMDGMPCSEAEMKALMGMFVEIMGMNMDGNNNNNDLNASSKKNGNKKSAAQTSSFQNPLFMFGGDGGDNSPSSNMPNGQTPPYWPDQESLAAATAGFFADGASWEALRRTYSAVYNNTHANENSGVGDADSGYGDDDDDDNNYEENESIPDWDDIRDVRNEQQLQHEQNLPPIAPGDWESLEQVAEEDVLEAEERARKAAKKREKKQRRKQKQKDEAAAKAAEAAQKKREKAILSWRSRVVSACQSGELPKLEALLQESPLADAEVEQAARFPHLEFLLPNVLAKNRSQLERGKETRYRLANYLLCMELRLAFIPLRSGRTALHTACFQGDLAFVELVLAQLDNCLEEYSSPLNAAKALMSRDDLNMTCSDSGWTLLHYAATSGSIDVLEVLLRAGCNVQTISDDTHTWRDRDGKGVTPRELVECIQSGTHEKVLESHGVALQEMQNSFLGNQSDRQAFFQTLDKVTKRLKEVEVNGYVAPGLLERSNGYNSDDGGRDQNGPSESSAAKKRKKKKKKKKQTAKESEATKADAAATTSTASVPLSAAREDSAEDFEDPLVTALLGMGFAKDQILAAVNACGGTSRATADDLVTWILGQNADDGVDADRNERTSNQSTTQGATAEVTEETNVRKMTDKARKAAEEENRQKVEAAKRLAEKREEQRRRNREWNNREQARQQQQAKAMFTQAAAPSAPRASSSGGLPAYSAKFPALTINKAPPGLHSGPSANGTAPPALQAGLPMKAMPPASSQPHGVKASSKASSDVTLLRKPAPALAASQASTTVTSPVSVKAAPVSGRGDDFASPPQSVPIGSIQAPAAKARAPPVSSPPPMTSQNSFPPIFDDDRTVSSFGSNRGFSVSSVPFVPPGISCTSSSHSAPSFAQPSFMQSAPPGMGQQLAGLPETEYDVDLGRIRPEAKEFVPKGYTPPPMAQSKTQEPSSNAPPPLSGNFATGLGASLSSSFPEAPSSLGNSSIPLSQGFLGGSRSPPATKHTLLGNRANIYDRIPTLTPASEDTSTTTPSIGSSLTGITGLDDSTLSTGLGTLGFGMEQQPGYEKTTSLFSPSFTNGLPTGGEFIWGGSGSSKTAPSLAGLPPFDFGLAPGGNSKEDNGDSIASDQLTSRWGPSGVSAGGMHSVRGGSIW